MVRNGIPGTMEIPPTGAIFIGTILTGSGTARVIIMTIDSTIPTIAAMARGGIKDSMGTTVKDLAPMDTSPVRLLPVPMGDINPVTTVRDLGIIINPGKVIMVNPNPIMAAMGEENHTMAATMREDRTMRGAVRGR